MKSFDNVYINGTGRFLPNEPVSNDEIADYIQPISKISSRIQKRILNENGIKTRYYGIDKDGQTTHSLQEMCAKSIDQALERARFSLEDIDLLCTGTVGGDTAIPGFANMLQGYMKAPPMETSTHTGICMSGVVALKHAAYAVETGDVRRALVSAGEFPSRMFKKSRFQNLDYNLDFDAHFLRWMLSDGAGTWALSDKPSPKGLSLKLNFVHTKSFSGDYPVCMYIGATKGEEEKSYLDYPSLAEAEKDGAFYLRQDIKILPNVFEVGLAEYVNIVNKGLLDPSEVDHFLCHYSSEKFRSVVGDLMKRANIIIDEEKWFSNLTYQGNMGSASIFVMLDDFLNKKGDQLKPGQKIFCFVPESGRFSVSYIMLEVTEPKETPESLSNSEVELPDSPTIDLKTQSENTSFVLRGLNEVWHEFRSQAWRSEFVAKIRDKKLSKEEYVNWMENWIPQVREGSKWMRSAVSNLQEPYLDLKEIIEHHASEEQNDWKILFKDYQNSGGQISDADKLQRNIGGEALNSFMYHRASLKNPIDLLGGIFIIEGAGQKIIPMLLPLMRKSTGLGPDSFKFLHYHGVNDENHILEWLAAVELVCDRANKDQLQGIIDTARKTAQFYLMQLNNL